MITFLREPLTISRYVSHWSNIIDGHNIFPHAQQRTFFPWSCQFVNFTEIMSMNVDASRQQAEFALAALMAVPSQYKATIELGILG